MSAESAIHIRAQQTICMIRVFSAYYSCDQSPGALPQADSDAAPLALAPMLKLQKSDASRYSLIAKLLEPSRRDGQDRDPLENVRDRRSYSAECQRFRCHESAGASAVARATEESSRRRR